MFSGSGSEIAFSLKSSYSFKDRAALPSYNYRTVFDVLDANGSLMKFQTEASSRLVFYFTLGGKSSYYHVPAGQEDALFGKDKILKVRLVWNGTSHSLYLNGTAVATFANTDRAPNWNNNSALVI